MINSSMEISLHGPQSEIYDNIKENLSKYLIKIGLPLNIVERRGSRNILVNYKEKWFDFNINNQTSQIQNLFDFLLKVNPKTGKICKCNDCANCPSKRMEDLLAKED